MGERGVVEAGDALNGERQRPRRGEEPADAVDRLAALDDEDADLDDLILARVEPGRLQVDQRVAGKEVFEQHEAKVQPGSDTRAAPAPGALRRRGISAMSRSARLGRLGAMEQKLQRTQAISGVLFSVFVLAHLFNQMLASLGAQTYDRVQSQLRAVYQWPLIEVALVFTPLVVHIAAGVARIVGRRRRQERPSPMLRQRLHRYSGYFLLAVIGGHALATRGASLFFDVFPRFEGIAFTLQWQPALFWPYYLLLSVAGLYHSIHGLGMALPMLGIGAGGALRRPALLSTFMVIGGAALVTAMLGFGGIIADVGQPDQSAFAQLLGRLGFVR